MFVGYLPEVDSELDLTEPEKEPMSKTGVLGEELEPGCWFFKGNVLIFIAIKRIKSRKLSVR